MRTMSVSLSVARIHAALLCKHGWTDRGPAWDGDSSDPRNIVLDWSRSFPHRFDAAFVKVLWPCIASADISMEYFHQLHGASCAAVTQRYATAKQWFFKELQMLCISNKSSFLKAEFVGGLVICCQFCFDFSLLHSTLPVMNLYITFVFYIKLVFLSFSCTVVAFHVLRDDFYCMVSAITFW